MEYAYSVITLYSYLYYIDRHLLPHSHSFPLPLVYYVVCSCVCRFLRGAGLTQGAAVAALLLCFCLARSLLYLSSFLGEQPWGKRPTDRRRPRPTWPRARYILSLSRLPTARPPAGQPALSLSSIGRSVGRSRCWPAAHSMFLLDRAHVSPDDRPTDRPTRTGEFVAGWPLGRSVGQILSLETAGERSLRTSEHSSEKSEGGFVERLPDHPIRKVHGFTLLSGFGRTIAGRARAGGRRPLRHVRNISGQ